MLPSEAPHHPGRGARKAAAYASRRVSEALREFKQLNSREARAAFADHWIGLWARDFDDAWPMVYELLRIVDEQELYSDPRRVGPGAGGGADTHGDRTYSDFASYFEDRVRRPFEVWADLEKTYRFVTDYAPDLFDRAFQEALSMAQRYEKAHDEADARHKEAIALGDEVPLAKRGEIGQGRADRTNNIRSINPSVGGTSESYLRRRLKRDRPDLYEEVSSGAKSASAAAIEARIRHRTFPIRADDAESAAGTIRRHMKPDVRQALGRLLLEDLSALKV